MDAWYWLKRVPCTVCGGVHSSGLEPLHSTVRVYGIAVFVYMVEYDKNLKSSEKKVRA